MDLLSNDKTPKRLILNSISLKKTPLSTPKNFVTRFNLLANNNGTQTPSPLLKSRVVRNPFENQLHERLHMPVISSPSLFHAPSTPKHSGKLELFEWTIEELSTLNPVNVVAHETQFREETDPEREAEAQAAISSFFSEHQIVPSPQNCQLRKQKIELRSDDQIYNSTALPDNLNRVSSCHNISKIKEIKDSRDKMTQTGLSFPTNLPKEVEDVFKKYFNNYDDDENSQENDDKNQSMMDISTLRRKLFIPPESPVQSPQLCSDDNFAIHLSPAPKTPELTHCLHNNQDDSLSSDMFGDMSPISLRNQSFNHSSPMSSPISCNDISMVSDVGTKTKHTPAIRRRLNNLKKKNLSTSFSMLQNEFDEEDSSDKENANFNIAMMPNKKVLTEPRRFARFDSGFDSSNSNQHLNMSTEFMQI